MKWLYCNDHSNLVNLNSVTSVFKATAGPEYEPHYIIATNQNILFETSMKHEREHAWHLILCFLSDPRAYGIYDFDDLEQSYSCEV